MNIDVLYITIVLVVILLSMTLHEAMHAFMGYFLGDDTAQREGRLTLNPIKHIDPFLTILLPVSLAITGMLSGSNVPIFGGAKPVPFNPNRVKYEEWGAAFVALAGPMTNLLIAFVGFGTYALLGTPDTTSLVGQILATVVNVNLGFFIFNMIPLPPLDGSRVLYALAPEFIRHAMEAIERFGIMFIFLIVIVASPVISALVQGVSGLILALFSKIFGV